MKLEDIAKKVGVSRSTVSRIINNQPYVGERTRQRVLKVIEQERFSRIQRLVLLLPDVPKLSALPFHKYPMFSLVITLIFQCLCRGLPRPLLSVIMLYCCG